MVTRMTCGLGNAESRIGENLGSGILDKILGCRALRKGRKADGEITDFRLARWRDRHPGRNAGWGRKATFVVKDLICPWRRARWGSLARDKGRWVRSRLATIAIFATGRLFSRSRVENQISHCERFDMFLAHGDFEPFRSEGAVRFRNTCITYPLCGLNIGTGTGNIGNWTARG